MTYRATLEKTRAVSPIERNRPKVKVNPPLWLYCYPTARSQQIGASFLPLHVAHHGPNRAAFDEAVRAAGYGPCAAVTLRHLSSVPLFWQFRGVHILGYHAKRI